jgi:two-component system phosphate regulon sensor histidine kinase PhoR
VGQPLLSSRGHKSATPQSAIEPRSSPRDYTVYSTTTHTRLIILSFPRAVSRVWSTAPYSLHPQYVLELNFLARFMATPTPILPALLATWLAALGTLLAAVGVLSEHGFSPRGSVGIAIAVIAVLAAAILVTLTLRRWRAQLNEQNEELASVTRSLSQALNVTPQPSPTASNALLSSSSTPAGLTSQLITELTSVRRNNEQLLETLNACTLPVLLIGTDRRVLIANTAAQQMLAGSAARILVGRSIEEALPQQDALRVYEHASGGTAREHNITLLTAAGHSRTIECVARPVRLAGAPSGGIAVVLTLHDISQLAQADRLRTDFVANASHELRTPLSSIKAAIETLADGAWDDHSMREKLANMTVTNIGRLETILRDLLDLSRLENSQQEGKGPDPDRLETIEVDSFLSGIAEGFIPLLAQRNLKVRTTLDGGPAQWHTDPRLLELIVRNLIDNATKFAFEGTIITVAASLTADALTLRVEDKGIGIPIEHQARIFERFYQSDSARTGVLSPTQRRGTGLGLAIVNQAVAQLGGDISVESVWKQGTTMIVRLPRISS